MHFLYFHYFQFLSVVVGVALVRHLKRARMVWLLLFCMWGVFIEVWARWVFMIGGAPNNYSVYNKYAIVAGPLLYFGFYRKMYFSKRNRFLFKVATAFIVSFYLIDLLFITGENAFASLSAILFYFVNTLLAVGALFEMAMDEETFNLTEKPMFWVAASLLIFSLGAIVVLGLSQYIRINQITIQNKALYRVIMPMVNVVLYSSITYAFILCRPRKKLSL